MSDGFFITEDVKHEGTVECALNAVRLLEDAFLTDVTFPTKGALSEIALEESFKATLLYLCLFKGPDPQVLSEELKLTSDLLKKVRAVLKNDPGLMDFFKAHNNKLEFALDYLRYYLRTETQLISNLYENRSNP